MVEAKMLDWFDPREFKLYQWVRAKTFDKLSIRDASGDDSTPVVGVWKERKEAESALRSYLNDLPSKCCPRPGFQIPTRLIIIIALATVTFIHGPAGSGKTRLLKAVLKETDRWAFPSFYMAPLN